MVDGVAAAETLTQMTVQGMVQGMVRAPAPVRPEAPAELQETVAQETVAQDALDELLNGDAPSDASIGLYSDMPEAIAAQDEVAPQAQADTLLEQEILAQDIASASLAQTILASQQAQQQTDLRTLDQSALGAIATSLEHIADDADRAHIVAALLDFMQIVGNGASEDVAATTARLQSALVNASAPAAPLALALALAGNEPEAQAATPLASAAAALAAPDLLATLARALQSEFETALPADWIAALMQASPAAAPASIDPYANPLLLAFQLGVLLGVKTTLNKPRARRDDYAIILPIFGLGECALHEDRHRDE